MRFYLSRQLVDHFPGLARIFRGYGTWVIFDIPVILLAFLIALLGRAITTELDIVAGLMFTLFVLAAFLSANHIMGNYLRYWSYAAAHDVVPLFAAASMATAVILFVELFMSPRPLPFSVVIVGGFFAFVGMTVIRYRRRLVSGTRWALRNSMLRLLADGTPTLIIGAGESGQALAFHMQMTASGRPYHLVGFLDDDPDKLGKIIHGLPVLGRCDQVQEIAGQRKAELIIIALHNISATRLRQLIDACMATSAQIRLLPDPLSTLISTPSLPALRQVSVEDLLGREAWQIDMTAVNAILRGRRVAVTGAAGSIGSELARQLLNAEPSQLLLLDNNESGLHDLVLELRHILAQREKPDCLLPVVGDVTQAEALHQALMQHRPHYVFHAAAYKHVSWMEQFPLQAVRANILGTHNVLESAKLCGAEGFLLVSSDKAADPASVMGATKRLCEMFVLGNAGQGMAVTVVRFGNVLGSRGSVVPTFERQIANGGPVTVTDSRMRRFLISVNEAVSLMLVAVSLTTGRDLFMLEMGDEISILELAQRMIRLRGLRPQIDIPIVFTGASPGEKMSEQFVGTGEELQRTTVSGVWQVIQVVAPLSCDAEHLIARFQEFVLSGDEKGALALLWSTVCPAEDSAHPVAAETTSARKAV